MHVLVNTEAQDTLEDCGVTAELYECASGGHDLLNSLPHRLSVQGDGPRI